MASTIRLFLNVEHSGPDEISGIGSKTTPYTYTTASDLQGGTKILVPAGTSQLVYRNLANTQLTPTDPTLLILIPTVDGNFTWVGVTTGGPDSVLAWKAGIPLMFGTGKTTAYSATVTGRAASAAEFISFVRFYNTGDEDGHVEVFAYK